MAQHLDSRCVFIWCYFHRIPVPLVPGVPTKTRLESRMKKFNPHLIYATAFSGINHYIGDVQASVPRSVPFL